MEKKSVPASAFGMFMAFIAVICKAVLLTMQLTGSIQTGRSTAFIVLVNGFDLLALISLLIYYARGGGKKDRYFFKAFLGLYALSQITAIIFGGNRPEMAIFCALGFASSVTLLFSLDLGKIKSYALTLFTLPTAIYWIIMLITGTSGRSVQSLVINTVTSVVIFISLINSVRVKYADKSERYAESGKAE